MAAFTALLAKIDERGTKLDQVDHAIADLRSLAPPRKQKRSARQLPLPLPKQSKKLRFRT